MSSFIRGSAGAATEQAVASPVANTDQHRLQQAADDEAKNELERREGVGAKGNNHNVSPHGPAQVDYEDVNSDWDEVQPDADAESQDSVKTSKLQADLAN